MAEHTFEGLGTGRFYVKVPSQPVSCKREPQAIRKRYKEQVFQAPETWAGIDLFLKKYDQEQGEKARGKTLDKLFLEQCIHKYTKGMLITGHDTTAGTIAYCLLELAKHPNILARVRAEHDELIHLSREETIKILRENSTKLHELPLTTAVVKERDMEHTA